MNKKHTVGSVLLTQLSKVGKVMLIPMVIMPIAGILGRLFSEELLNVPTVANISTVVFANIGLMFAMAAAVAYSKTKDKTSVLFASAISYLIFSSNLEIIDKSLNAGAFGGLIYGVAIALLYNYSSEWKLPSGFNFFAGDKMVITLSPILALLMSYVFGFIWPYFQGGLNIFGVWIGSLGVIGIFIYGLLNRLLIPFGLHHVLNAYFAFEYGTYVNGAGETIKGDIMRYLAGDPTAGSFFSGMYIVIMFGIPAINFAMSKTAKYNLTETKGMMRGNALTAFLSGVSEPTEFSFMFASPKLYAIHSVYSGLAGASLFLLGSRVGTFNSSGVIDYAINYGFHSSNAWIVIPVGLIFSVLYYVTFKFIIERDNVLTPGREEPVALAVETPIAEMAESETETVINPQTQYQVRGKLIYTAVGGRDNIINLENCITRLRFELKDVDLVDEAKIKQAGAQGIMKLSTKDLQVIIGTEVGSVATEINKLLS